MAPNLQTSARLFLVTSLVVALSGYAIWPTQAFAAPKLYDVSIVEVAGRPGHMGVFPIQGQPIKGSKVSARARLIGAATGVNLLVLDASGNVLSLVPMMVPSAVRALSGTYFADILVPNEPFTFAVSGNDASGTFRVSQSGSELVAPQTLHVRMTPAVGELSRTLANLIVVHVTNFGAAESVNVSLATEEGGSISPPTAQVVLGSKRTASFSFNLTLPPSAEGLLTLKATASSATVQSVTNTAFLRVPITLFRQERLSAWLDKEHKKLDKGKFVDVSICDVGVNPATIVLANDQIAQTVKRVPAPSKHKEPKRRSEGLRSENPEDEDDDDGVDAHDCRASSILLVRFDAAHLLAAMGSSAFPTDVRLRKPYTLLPIAAFATDGTQLLGYVAVRTKQADAEGDRHAR